MLSCSRSNSPTLVSEAFTASAYFRAPPNRSNISGGTNLISRSAVPEMHHQHAMIPEEEHR